MITRNSGQAENLLLISRSAATAFSLGSGEPARELVCLPDTARGRQSNASKPRHLHPFGVTPRIRVCEQSAIGQKKTEEAARENGRWEGCACPGHLPRTRLLHVHVLSRPQSPVTSPACPVTSPVVPPLQRRVRRGSSPSRRRLRPLPRPARLSIWNPDTLDRNDHISKYIQVYGGICLYILYILSICHIMYGIYKYVLYREILTFFI